MKKFVICIALFGLVGLTACTNESPTPKPVPTVVPDEWSVATLTVSDPAPLVGATVQVQALIYNNGAQADNGTTVTFTASGGAFGDGSTETTADTQSGRALVLFSADEAGNYVINAQVQTASKSVTVSYQGLGGDALQIYQPLVPNVGSFDGGETVMLRGKGIMGPVEVTFTVEGIPYPAIVQEVEESNPLSADGEITVTSPFISAGNTNQNQPADVQVKGGVGTASEQTVNMIAAFTYLANAGGGEPIIYALDPDYGRSEGGDQVVVLGSDLNDATRFEFGFRGQQLLAQILTVSQDGQQMAIMTPRFSATPLDAPETASATVTTPVSTFTLNEAFIIVADDPQPELASLSPIAGPLDGGTLVTVFGSGFKMPVQVTFGVLAATDVNLVDDQSPADNDMITCLSPNYSQQGQEPPVTVDVQVTNMTSGKMSNTLPFTYGDNLFISGNSPTEGERGDVVLVFGSGFEDPLQVFYTGNNREVEVQSVSGTEISARIPLEWPVDCADRTGAFSVTLIESNQTTTGGDFTLLGNTPTVTDVEPTFVQETDFGNGVDPNDIVIHGADFADDLLVKINNYVMSPSDVTAVNANTIEVENIPAPNEFGLVFDTTSCTTNDGLQGVRKAATPVDVSVANLPGNCQDTLTGGLIYEPEDTTCVASSMLNFVLPPFPDAAAGSCTSSDLSISNGGAGALEVYTLNLVGRFFFDGGASSQNAPGFSVPPFSTAPSVPIYFCPDAQGNNPWSGNLSIQNSSPSNPINVALSGNEAFPVLAVSTNNIPFPDSPVAGGQVTQPLTIFNNGGDTLNWSLSVGGTDPANFWIQQGSNGTVPPMSSVVVDVVFNPTAVRSFDAVLTLTADESDAQGSPQVITVSGNGI